MKTKLTWIAIAAIAAFSGWTFYRTLNTPRIAFVRSAQLVEGFTGMKEARASFTKKTQTTQANIDSLQKSLMQSINSYSAERSSLSKEEQQKREQLLGMQQNAMQQYVAAMEERSGEEESEMTQGVLNQINSFVEQYGREQGYTVILGTTLSGNVLYGEDIVDITDEVLTGLNTSYKASPPAQEK